MVYEGETKESSGIKNHEAILNVDETTEINHAILEPEIGKTFACDECSTVFSLRHNLLKHVRKSHNGKKT